MSFFLFFCRDPLNRQNIEKVLSTSLNKKDFVKKGHELSVANVKILLYLICPVKVNVFITTISKVKPTEFFFFSTGGVFLLP